MKIAQYLAAAAFVLTSATFAQPVVTQVLKSGASTAGGETLCLIGTFPAGTPTVTIGSSTATIQQSTPTMILCLTPPGIGENLLQRVTIAGQNSNFFGFYSYDRPVISQITPANGPTTGVNQVVIEGANFGPNPTAWIGDVVLQRLWFTENSITARVFPGQGANLPVRVFSTSTIANVVSTNSPTFSYNPPTISNANPAPNTQGGAIALTGTNFGQTPVVRVGTQDISPVPGSVTATGLQFPMPAGAGTGIPISVVVAEQVSNTFLISYAAPSISFGSPTIGSTSGDTIVTISGSNLGTASNAHVLFDGVPVAIEPGSLGHSQLRFRVPPGEGTNLPYFVVTGGQTSNFRLFSYSAPSITSISPNNVSVDGNDLVLISGTDLGINPTVYIGGAIAPVVMSNHTSILCRAPAHVSGVASVNVIVANQPSNQSSINYICDADFNGDGEVDFFDYLDFVDAYSISC